jgi:hypothetical protein
MGVRGKVDAHLAYIYDQRSPASLRFVALLVPYGTVGHGVSGVHHFGGTYLVRSFKVMNTNWAYKDCIN